MKKRYFLIVLAIVVLLVIAAAFYYIHAARSIEVRSLSIKRVENVTLSGMKIYGEIELYNPSLVSIEYSDINLRTLLKDTGSKLSEGKISGGKIGPRSMSVVSFVQNVRFSGLLDVVLDVMKSNRTVIGVEGNVSVKGMPGTTVPFRADYDVNRELKDYANKKIGNVDSIIESIGSLFG